MSTRERTLDVIRSRDVRAHNPHERRARSGTSSMKPKLIPCFDSKPGRAASSLAHQGSAAILKRSFPPRSSANKVLGFLYAGN
ncbi:hypothetical protein Sango_0289700 [Sesamum angolense]|uniref:Uncharacterized protein n=1 Tax=Sesamum angolense TaxID=2727404 RepID=A0AAE2C2W1_9LAMI|nr:hypothetical protein Sango_0289700 [Sesamum angolense]